MSTQQKKILVVLTSAGTALNGKPTGLWLTEFVHPYYELKDTFALSYASPKGGAIPVDPVSVDAAKDDKLAQRFKEDAEGQKVLQNTAKLSDVNAADYDAVFYPGGHGPVIDLAFDSLSQKLIVDFWNAGKPVAAVCHAPAVFANVKLADGTAFIKGKRFAGFTNSEEAAVDGASLVPFLLETKLIEEGGHHEKGADWEPKVVADGQLYTGQNPASAGPLAEKLKDALTSA